MISYRNHNITGGRAFMKRWVLIALMGLGAVGLAPRPASAFALMGAIVCDYSADNCGYAVGFVFQDQAVAAATQACINHGGGVKHCVHTIVFDSCGAAVTGLYNGNRRGGRAVGMTRQLAIAHAMSGCESTSTDCHIVVAICSGESSPPPPQPPRPSFTGPMHPQPPGYHCPPGSGWNPGWGGCS